MYHPSQHGGHGPPAAFVPASQQQQQQPQLNVGGGGALGNRSSRAVSIVPPSADAKSAFVARSAAQSNVDASPSPSKAALSAKAASAAVFVPKGGATTPAAYPSPSPSAAKANVRGGQYDDNGSTAVHMMHDMTLDPHNEQGQPMQYTPYLGAGNDDGRGTPTSFGGGYEGDGMNSAFDPTYAGPLPGSAQQKGHQNNNSQSREMQPARPYNPYEHLNEFGEPTDAAIGGGMDFYAANAASHNAAAVKMRQAMQYHLYSPSMPHVSNLHPQHLSANAFFMSAEEREELQRKNEALHAGIPPPELGGPKLPEELHVYHSLVPLEPCPLPGMPGNSIVPQLIDPQLVPPTAPGTVNHLTGACGEPSRVFGYRCHVYKAQCTLDGKYYVLRRLENFRLTHEAAIALVERWRRIRHPSIVSVREAFTTRAFGDASIVFVYDYHPLAASLYAEHMVPKPPRPDRRTGRMQSKPMQIAERTLWSYLCQLTNVLLAIHQHGLAARCIAPSKVIRTGKNRIRINCCSIFDVIAYDPNATDKALRGHQAEDLVNLGRLILSLACNNVGAIQNVQRSLDQIARAYSTDLRSIIVWLISEPGEAPLPTISGVQMRALDGEDVDTGDGEKTIDRLRLALAPKFAEEFDSSLNHNDLLESGLAKELENARLVRLLCKFGFINERPEFDHDPRWSGTGDRYIIKLFRDHVFHAVDGAGRPVVDLTHILTNLNKLDAASLEKIMLTSRDEQSCLVVSYREIKNCIDAAFADLSRSR
jgi:PAB-dependent poly(A)-specific ribonuclease subunit 3